METIFENYEHFIKENQDDMSTPQDAVRLLTDDSMFREYADSLTEGLTGTTKDNVMQVLNREREMILQESANVAASTFTSAWTVLSFPILVDIYSEPLLAEIASMYPTDKPALTIPRVRIKSTVTSYDGTTETSAYIPTATSLIRANEVTVNVSTGSNNNIFTLAGVSSSSFRMNRRYTLMTSLVATDASGDASNTTVSLNYRPDNRNQIARTASFTKNDGTTAYAQINGHFNYQDGKFTYSVVYTDSDGNADGDLGTDHAVLSLRFTPYNTMNGRNIVTVETENTDVFIDPNSYWGLYQ